MVLRLEVEAHPNARVERVEYANGLLRAWVRAPALDGRANTAIEHLIAETLGLRARQVQIVGGVRSRKKVIEVDGPPLEVLRARLAELEPT